MLSVSRETMGYKTVINQSLALYAIIEALIPRALPSGFVLPYYIQHWELVNNYYI